MKKIIVFLLIFSFSISPSSLSDIQQETLRCLKNGFYLNSAQEKVFLNKETTHAIQNSCQCIYNDDEYKKFLGSLTKKFPTTSIKVINADCLKIAIQSKNNGDNPLLLNMANAFIPGGGYQDGAPSQESHLFRCSALPYILDPHWKKQPSNFYPFPPESCVYSLDVPFFRIVENGKNVFLKKPVLLSVVSCAAQRLASEKHWNKTVEDYTRNSIRTQLYLGYTRDHNVLILGAFGCGVFCNPPEKVAQLYLEEIKKMPGCFKEIIFPILPENRKKHLGKENENLELFSKFLSGELTNSGTLIKKP